MLLAYLIEKKVSAGQWYQLAQEDSPDVTSCQDSGLHSQRRSAVSGYSVY